MMVTPVRKRPSSPDSKSAQIRALLDKGMSAGAIAKQVGCSRNLVYVVKSNSRGSASKPAGRRGPGLPGKANAGAAIGLEGIVAAVKGAEREREAMRAALLRIQEVVGQALA